MTIIVADASVGLMAADTLVTEQDLKSYRTVKIFRCEDGSIAGAAGLGTAGLAFLEWAIAGRKRLISAAKLTGLDGALILQPDGKILRFDSHPKPDVVIGDFAAVGCGRDVALGARHAGASAEGCVRAAIDLVTHCGGEVTVIHLEGKTNE
jgi:hypothetical protein